MVLTMIGASFAAVPLYDMFCKVSGYGGTTARALNTSGIIGSKNIKVFFDSNLDDKLPWRFIPLQRQVNIIPGQNVLAFYESENLTDRSIKGMAVYNVTPFKVGKYFKKIECFCFEEFILAPKQKVTMPVLFFIDPAIEQDPNAQEVQSITLSYTFYPLE